MMSLWGKSCGKISDWVSLHETLGATALSCAYAKSRVAKGETLMCGSTGTRTLSALEHK